MFSSSSSPSPLHGEQQRFSPERAYRPRVSPPSVEDRDACAIYASVRKDATPSRAPVELALANLQKILQRRRLSSEHVVAVRIHLIEFKRFYERMNRVYAGFFTGAKVPARSCIGVSALTRGALVEMDFIVKERA